MMESPVLWWNLCRLGRSPSIQILIRLPNGLQMEKMEFLCPAEGTEEVANAIERAITDDVLVDTAAKKNRDLVQDNFVDSVVKPRVLEMYGNVFDLIN